ncbi:hypothetical protein SISNIDRAFT_394236, partial [Sistotremastrum niveocremeum HHB9708]
SLPIPIFLLLSCLTSLTSALHFYLESTEMRCFVEELPSSTVLEGHYRALEWHPGQNAYLENPSLGIQVDVEEVQSGHSVVRTLGPSDGRFTFTSHDAGDHSICLYSNYSSSSSSSGSPHIKLYLEIVVGSSKPDIEKDRSHVSNLAAKIRDLNSRIEEIRREQQYQREREAAFRDLSESINSRAVWYILIEILVLVGTCVWQLRHLK